MKFLLVAVACLAFVACAYSANPPTPVWPAAFSATVIVTRSRADVPTVEYFRWFYDATNQRERFDGIFTYLGSQYFRELIVDYAKSTEYNILTRGNILECFIRKPVGKLIKPNFANYTYAGFALINYELTYHWSAYNRTSGGVYQYFETADDHEPAEFDYAHPETNDDETWTFLEFDSGAQDPDLWVIPEPISLACNYQQPLDEPKMLGNSLKH